MGMQSTSEVLPRVPAAVRLERAQQRIRDLTTGAGALTPEHRLELAQWQREWVAAWRESEYVAAA
jgi:hypothetical protein